MKKERLVHQLLLAVTFSLCNAWAGTEESIASFVTEEPVQSSPVSWEPLFEAVRQENIEELRDLLSKGASLATWNGEDRTPLEVAVDSGNLAMVELLLKSEAVRVPSGFMNAALILAVARGEREMTELLLERGADVNVKGSLGQTPLHRAVDSENVGLARLLLERGADVNAEDHGRETPLHRAVHSANTELTELLLERGADVHAKDRWEKTPLVGAVSQGNIEQVKLLLERGADVKARDYDGKTPLHWVARELDDETSSVTVPLATVLLEAGADANAKAFPDNPSLPLEGNRTPLQLAARVGDCPLAKLLLKWGAVVHATDFVGETPLHWAADGEMVRILLEAGADIKARNKLGETPLHKALLFDRIDAVRALIAAGAELETRTESGATPLCYAAALDVTGEVVKLLIEAGAEVNTSDSAGEAIPLLEAVINEHPEAVRVLLEAGADVRVVNSLGYTPLRCAEKCLRLAQEYQQDEQKRIEGSIERLKMELEELKGKKSNSCRSVIELLQQYERKAKRRE